MIHDLRPYLWLARLTLLRQMAYRMRYLTGIATYGIFVGALYFVWKAIYAQQAASGGGERIGGLTLAELTTYLTVGYVARAAYFTNTDGEIAARVGSGDVTLDLLKPIHFHGQWLSQAAGETLFRLLFFAAPMALVLGPLFGVMAPQGHGWWQFPLLFLAAFWINAELNLLVGTCAVWLESIQGLLSLKRNLMLLLSGTLVPLHFLPDGLAAVMGWLPFALLSYLPNLAWLGQLGQGSHPTFGVVAATACGWILVLRLANLRLWARARARFEAQGG